MRHSRRWLPAGAGCSAHRRRRNVAAPTAALQQQVLSAAAGGLHTVSSAVQGSTRLVAANIDPVVLGSTASASFKLFLICAAVGWLLKTRRIPNDTASVLSQVSIMRWTLPFACYQRSTFSFLVLLVAPTICCVDQPHLQLIAWGTLCTFASLS